MKSKFSPLAKLLITFAILVVLFAAGLVVLLSFNSHAARVYNLSKSPVTDVVLELRDNIPSDWTTSKRVAGLNPGETLEIRHSHNDTYAVVAFTLEGRRIRHDVGYVDLWMGESYRIEILPEGKVISGYDHGHKLDRNWEE